MIQNTKAQVQTISSIGMSVEHKPVMQNKKINDVLLSDVVKSPSTDCAL